MTRNKLPLTVGKSAIHGHGVFTKVPIKKGQFIAELRGSKVIYKSSFHGQSNRYADWIGISKDTWIDPIDEFQYLNHSCNPNAGLRGARTLRLHAITNIQVGEEITIDYATTEEDSDYCFENLEEPHEFYRRFVGPIQSLPVEVYRRYFPSIPKYFIKVYENEVILKDNGK